MQKILLVDDEADAVEVLEWILTDFGFVVKTACSGEQALAVARDFRPDILITDHCLQGELTGADVIRVLRETDATLRAVLTSGLPKEQLERELRGLTDLEILGKPFTSRELRATLEHPPSGSGVMKVSTSRALDQGQG